MISKKTPDQWFAEYGESHQHPTNKLIHWVCVPLIYLVIIGLLWSIPKPAWMGSSLWLNWGTLASLVVFAFYLRLSWRLAIGLGIFMLLVLIVLAQYSTLGIPLPLWQSCLIGFIALWIGQFVGHAIEGKKPSFFQDIQFLLIGPAWLMGFIYQKLGIAY